jgi:hypothetical protein
VVPGAGLFVGAVVVAVAVAGTGVVVGTAVVATAPGVSGTTGVAVVVPGAVVPRPRGFCPDEYSTIAAAAANAKKILKDDEAENFPILSCKL